MPLSELTHRLVEQKLAALYERRVPRHLRDEIRLKTEFRGNSVTVVEERPALLRGGEWTKLKLAQLRFDSETGDWRLYCSDRNGKWHWYFDLDPTPNVEAVIAEIDADPTGIFWG